MERRQFGRRTTYLHGWLKVAGRPALRCIVRNLSASGAFLEVEPPSWLPFQFEVRIDGQDKSRACTLRHVLSRGVGVSFVELEDVRTEMADRGAITIDNAAEWMGKASARSPRVRP